MTLPAQALLQIYHSMLDSYGDQNWWPADSAFEVAVGAVLTQNTAWSNVEKAINNLKQASVLDLSSMLALPLDQLAQLIRPSGYYNIKAQRLRALCKFIDKKGGMESLFHQDLSWLRDELLSVKGVGPETADDILLYACDKPVFVIDTYTRRLLQRHGLIQGREDYETLRLSFEEALGPDVDIFKQYHALIVMHAKVACCKKPVCEQCCMNRDCLKKI